MPDLWSLAIVTPLGSSALLFGNSSAKLAYYPAAPDFVAAANGTECIPGVFNCLTCTVGQGGAGSQCLQVPLHPSSFELTKDLRLGCCFFHLMTDPLTMLPEKRSLAKMYRLAVSLMAPRLSLQPACQFQLDVTYAKLAYPAPATTCLACAANAATCAACSCG